MVETRLRGALEGGRSVVVGTVDPYGIASCCRGIALRAGEDLGTVTVYVPAATSREVVANAATTRKLAVTTSAPLDHSTLQLKGTARDVRMARDDEQPFLAARFDEFAAVLEQIGLSRRVSSQVTCWPAFAIEVLVEEIYDQTPGPRAGTPLG